MPTIPPPVDGAAAVSFDPGAATALAAALDDLARHLDRLRAAEGSAFERASVDWRGGTATWAAHQRSGLIEQVQRVAKRCEAAAAEARGAIGQAAEAQAARNASATVIRQQAEARAALGAERTP